MQTAYHLKSLKGGFRPKSLEQKFQKSQKTKKRKKQNPHGDEDEVFHQSFQKYVRAHCILRFAQNDRDCPF